MLWPEFHHRWPLILGHIRLWSFTPYEGFRWECCMISHALDRTSIVNRPFHICLIHRTEFHVRFTYQGDDSKITIWIHYPKISWLPAELWIVRLNALTGFGLVLVLYNFTVVAASKQLQVDLQLVIVGASQIPDEVMEMLRNASSETDFRKMMGMKEVAKKDEISSQFGV